jgi:hypothetical protein
MSINERRFSFWICFLRSPRRTMNIDVPRWELSPKDATPPIVICSPKEIESIRDSKQLILKSEGWKTREEAKAGATRYTDALRLSLARLKIGADFGSRKPKSGYFGAGLEKLIAQTGREVMNDAPGPIIYDSAQRPLVASVGKIDLLEGIRQDRFERVFAYAIEHPQRLKDNERLSLDLFNASFFHNTADSRFLMLAMAIEALLEPAPRSTGARTHVESLIKATRETSNISQEEKDSLLASLNWLLDESINQAGRRLAQNRLGTRLYSNKSAPIFFSYCYGLRSRLVHGKHPLPEQAVIESAAAELEVYVSDLLSGQLLEVNLE